MITSTWREAPNLQLRTISDLLLARNYRGQELNIYTKRRGQKEPEEVERSPTSFLKESYIGSIRYLWISPFQKGFKEIRG